jgi:hypothetical protein
MHFYNRMMIVAYRHPGKLGSEQFLFFLIFLGTLPQRFHLIQGEFGKLSPALSRSGFNEGEARSKACVGFTQGALRIDLLPASQVDYSK